MQPNAIKSLALSLPLLATLLAACGQGQQQAPQQGEPEVSVLTIAPAQATLTTTLSGRTSARLTADVRPQVGGIILKRLFTEGSLVKAGEVLYTIDPAPFQAAYQQANAAYRKAEASAVPARLKGERYVSLAATNAVSKQENDEVQALRHEAEADLGSARANLDNARISLAYTRVTAPISGYIGKSSVTPGALVTANQATALATIQQTDQIYVDVTQSSAEVLRLKRALAAGSIKRDASGGAKVKLFFEDGSPYSMDGVLQFSDITVDQSTGVVTLRALFPNPKGELLPGLYVRAVIEEGVQDNAILVPQAAVSRDNKGNPLVMLVKQDGTVEPRPIEVDRVLGDAWLVRSGLAAGDRVIVEGLQKARPGSKVKAVEAAKPGQDSQNATAPAPETAAKPAESNANATAGAAAPTAAAAPAKPEAKPAAKSEVKSETKADAKPSAKQKSDKKKAPKAEAAEAAPQAQDAEAKQ